jgi:hypothetical protein
MTARVSGAWRLSKLLGACLVAFVSAGCAGPSSPDMEIGTPIVLGAPMQEVVQALLKDYRPPVSSLTIRSMVEVDNRGQSGRVVTNSSVVTFDLLESGLWASDAIGDGAPAGREATLSLCGLDGMVIAGGLSVPSTFPAPTRVGNNFLPFGVLFPVDVGYRRRMNVFRATASNVCAPEIGTEFSYDAELESFVRTAGLFRFTASGIAQYRRSCAISREVRPAREFGVPVDGDGLYVTCESKLQSGESRWTEFVLARSVGIYFLTSAGRPGDPQVIKVRYNNVEIRR